VAKGGGSGEVVFRVTADEAKALRAYQNLIDKQARAALGARDLGKASKQGGKSAQSSLASGARAALGFAGAMTGIGSAVGGVMLIVNQLKQEYRHLIEQQSRARWRQMDVGAARVEALRNLPTGMDAASLERFVVKTAARKGFEMPETRAWQVAGSMLSGKGALSQQQFRGAYGEALKYGAVGSESFEAATVGGAIADVMKLTGTSGKGALGFMRQFGTAARVVDPALQATALARSGAAAKPMGFTVEQSAEITAALSQLGGDTEGKVSSTAFAKLAKLMADLRYKKPIRVGRKSIGLTQTGMGALEEMQGIMQGLTPEEQTAFLTRMQLGKAGGRGAMMQLLTGSEAGTAALATAQQQIGAPGPASAAAVDEFYANVAKGRHETLRTTRRAMSKGIETQELANVSGGIASELRRVEDYLKATPGISLTETQIGTLMQELKTGVGTASPRELFDAAIGRIQGMQARHAPSSKTRYATTSGRLNLIDAAVDLFTTDYDYGLPEDATPRGREGRYWSPSLKKEYVAEPNPDYNPAVEATNEQLITILTEIRDKLPENAGSTGPPANMNGQVPD